MISEQSLSPWNSKHDNENYFKAQTKRQAISKTQLKFRNSTPMRSLFTNPQTHHRLSYSTRKFQHRVILQRSTHKIITQQQKQTQKPPCSFRQKTHNIETEDQNMGQVTLNQIKRVKSVGKFNRFFIKKSIGNKQSEQMSYSKPPTPILCKKLNNIIKKKQIDHNQHFLRERSSLLQPYHQKYRSEAGERGTILNSKLAKKTIAFCNSKPKEQQSSKKLSFVKQKEQKNKKNQHLLDKLFSKNY